MKTELDEALCRDFPNLYKSLRHRGPEAPSSFGFSTGDGWEPVIRRLSEKLEKLIVEMPEDQREHCRASQVKEKFGGLRFYMSSSTDAMEKAIAEAEDECSVLCETCGGTGSSRGGGWIRTLCDVCNAAYVNERLAKGRSNV